VSAATQRRRCAVYTRKSSEEGLEQDFNSLHAQREACEAYIKSQAGEGWTLIKSAYDDGGISGGTMDRPGLKRLLADITKGLIDVVVVYKVDRLTRSLGDFARIVETFDAKGVSFVSITQAFNTTTSMGRLTLNVLLSFAQFEREVTGERIRDKIAASKAKGMWMGGMVPLGYDPKDRTLVVNEPEAERVRHIFGRYLALGSVHTLVQELEAQGIRSKAWVTLEGRSMGGLNFTRGALYHLLQNQTYLGNIKHKDLIHPGLHAPIVPTELFETVQRHLSANRVERGVKSRGREDRAILTGLLFNNAGRPMTPTFGVGRRGGSYRYYASPTYPSQDQVHSGPRRIPGPSLEAFVAAAVRGVAGKPVLEMADIQSLLNRIDVRAESVELVLSADILFAGGNPELGLASLKARLADGEGAYLEPGEAPAVRVHLPVRMQFRGGRTWLSGVTSTAGVRRPKVNKALVQALRRSHAELKRLKASPLDSNPFKNAYAAPETTHLTRLVKLAFLSPDIQLDILNGRHSPTLSLKSLLGSELPLEWDAQRRWIQEL
jgi:site-specific DNA recombinase